MCLRTTDIEIKGTVVVETVTRIQFASSKTTSYRLHSRFVNTYPQFGVLRFKLNNENQAWKQSRFCCWMNSFTWEKMYRKALSLPTELRALHIQSGIYD